MATPLLAEFPELSKLSYVVCFLLRAAMNPPICRREDLEDLLTDPLYFQAVFHSLERVQALYQAQEELGMANEAIASKRFQNAAAPNVIE
jgi:ESCRT-I complex subunit VPS37